ncbi:MAG: diacylglycerol kinase family lipid kinase [Clostridiales bacterium]|nr:diacylglycerol kinase family lipid kinase [Clostridiales bacterium]
MTEFCLIVNPIAGRGAAKRALAQASALLAEKGHSFSVMVSEYAGHSTELAKQAVREGHAVIVALGGDGTVREVAIGLLGSDVVMGILPCGTGNDFARPLQIPKEIEKSVDILLHGEDRRIDAGYANDEFFINVAGFGFDVDVLDATEFFKTKPLLSASAYMLGLLRSLTRLQLRDTKIIVDGVEMQKRVLLIAAGNGTHFGGGMQITPQALPHDGLLDLCIVHDVTRRTVLRVLPKLMKGTHIKETKFVTYLKARECTAISSPIARTETDGEVVGLTPVTFRVEANALTIRMPG